MSNWRDDEIRELLSVRADADIVRQMQGTARDSVIYDQITNRLRARGVVRAKAQVNNKLKALKKQYYQYLDQNGRTGSDGKTWCYFSLCEAIWGPSQSANPVASVGSMETASTSRSPDTLSTSICIKTSYSDTEEQTPVYETDVSINDSVLSTESSCHSPPKRKRRRKETHTNVTHPSPSTSPCTSAKKKRCTIDDAILTRLAHLDEERQTFRQQDSEDLRFAAVIVDMLANVNPKHKSEVKLKIYQLLFEAGRDFPKQS